MASTLWTSSAQLLLPCFPENSIFRHFELLPLITLEFLLSHGGKNRLQENNHFYQKKL